MFSEPLLVLQMDSMKSSIKALTKDKKDYENKYKESQEELAKKEKLLTNCQGRQKLYIPLVIMRLILFTELPICKRT